MTLNYEGDIINCEYYVNGKLYKDKNFYYERQFKDGMFNGLGKL